MPSTAKVKWFCCLDMEVSAKKSTRIIPVCLCHSNANYLNSFVSVTPGKITSEGIFLKLPQESVKLTARTNLAGLPQQFCLFTRRTAIRLLKNSSKCFEGHCNLSGMSCSKAWLFNDLSSMEKQR